MARSWSIWAVTGWVWYENGDAAGTLANQWINDSNDVKATGTKVVASYLNDEVTILIDEWAAAHKGYSLDDMKAAQAEIIAKYQEEHGVGSHIAESVVGTADANGKYYIPFRGCMVLVQRQKVFQLVPISGILWFLMQISITVISRFGMELRWVHCAISMRSICMLCH